MNSIVVPRHIALLPDGNRRWAKERGLDTLEGHKVGYENLVRFCDWCQERGVEGVTAFGFSTENWNRSAKEVEYLMRLLEMGLATQFRKYIDDAKFREKGMRVRVIGQKDRLPKSLQKVISEVEEGTEKNDKFFVNLAISYGGRWDIVQATKRLIEEKVPAEKITEEVFASYLSTAGLPEPDLFIRAGGEKRLSNLVLWQAAYTELYFSPKYWPAFGEQDLDEAIQDFASRARRFGR